MIAITDRCVDRNTGLITTTCSRRQTGYLQGQINAIFQGGRCAMSFNYLEAYKASRKLFPVLESYGFSSSRDGSGVITVKGNVPRTAFERYNFQLILDKKTLNEVHRLDIRDQNLGVKIFYIQESMHFGDWGGIVLKIAYAFFGITFGFLVLTGFVVYLK